MEDLRGAAGQARECAVMGQSVTLARWIAAGRRPVTPGRVLRKADVAAAGAALGVDVPARLRTMADIRCTGPGAPLSALGCCRWTTDG